jgi:hypothetical protein
MMKTPLVAGFVVALGAANLAACGAEGGAGQSDGPMGSAVAVIGGETFEFDVQCRFSSKQTGWILAIRDSGEGDLRLLVSSSRSDADDPDSVPHDHISIEGGDESYTALNLATIGQPGFLEIDGKTVSATTEFMVNESAVNTVDGTFEATCA